VYFTEVSGLGIASNVRFAGLIVGTVVDMELAPDGAGPVRVRLEVAEGTPIRTTSRASVESQGVTGVSKVSITAGDPESPLLRQATGEPVPVIESGRSALQTLSDQGPELIENLNQAAAQLTELLGSQNQTRVANILDNVERSSGNLDKAMADISAATDAIGTAAEGIATFGEKLDTLGATADEALKNFSQAAETADGTLASATQTLDEVRDYVGGDLRSLTQTLDQTATTLQADFSRLAARSETTLDNLDQTLASGTAAFNAAETMFSTDLGPVVSDLQVTLGKVNDTLDSVSDDLPQITGQLRNAADSAASAFDSMRGMMDSARAPVQAFTNEALPQFSRLSLELRGLVDNVNQLVTALRRNPAQIITGPRTPEFRR